MTEKEMLEKAAECLTKTRRDLKKIIAQKLLDGMENSEHSEHVVAAIITSLFIEATALMKAHRTAIEGAPEEAKTGINNAFDHLVKDNVQGLCRELGYEILIDTIREDTDGKG